MTRLDDITNFCDQAEFGGPRTLAWNARGSNRSNADDASGLIRSELPTIQECRHVSARALDACKPATLIVSRSISAHGESR